MKRKTTADRGRAGRERWVLLAMGFLFMSVLLAGCSGPMLVTEYMDDMETGEETVVYDGKGHPVITSEQGYVYNPYAESYSLEKEDFRRHGNGVLPE